MDLTNCKWNRAHGKELSSLPLPAADPCVLKVRKHLGMIGDMAQMLEHDEEITEITPYSVPCAREELLSVRGGATLDSAHYSALNQSLKQ